MFTGLIEGQGKVLAIDPEGAGVLLSIEPPADLDDGAHTEVALGESVAINGCCLTVVSFDENTWRFQAGSETLSRTNLGHLQAGDVVNIERALRANARLGGHFVQGHVDDTGTVAKIDREGEWVFMWFKVPPRLTRQMVSKGSICVDGISLTLVEVSDDQFSVALIPHTLDVTTLGQRQPGDMVNIETDILGKYIEKLVSPAS